MKRRIWELDAFRGLCILGMVVVHLVYDLTELYHVVDWRYPHWFALVMQWGGVLFILLSGVCATLGSAPVRRGMVVFGCGMVCTAVTGIMCLGARMDPGIVIWFGVLHCLGVCMLLWKLVGHFPAWALGVTGAALCLTGLLLQNVRVDFPWLIPLGIIQTGFRSSDYFPLILNFGWFLLGGCLGKNLYRQRQTRFPRVNENAAVVGILCWCGRKSLFIYLLHQPVITVVVTLLRWIL